MKSVPERNDYEYCSISILKTYDLIDILNKKLFF